jgi:hypothetical protein
MTLRSSCRKSRSTESAARQQLRRDKKATPHQQLCACRYREQQSSTFKSHVSDAYRPVDVRGWLTKQHAGGPTSCACRPSPTDCRAKELEERFFLLQSTLYVSRTEARPSCGSALLVMRRTDRVFGLVDA